MKPVLDHVTRCAIAGFVALLPIGGLVASVAYAEYVISQVWLADQDFYFPGLGLVAVAILLYAVGFIVSSFLGRWLWKRADGILDGLPALGQLYRTLKQILGYGEGEDAIFQDVVLIPAREPGTEELGLVTNELDDESPPKLTVFVPGAPNPAAGRLVVIEASRVKRLEVPVNDVLKALVSLGKVDLSLAEEDDAPGE